MFSANVRGPLAATLTVAGVGQALIVAGSLLSRVLVDLPSRRLDAVSLGSFYGVLTIGAGACAWGAYRLRHSSHRASQKVQDQIQPQEHHTADLTPPPAIAPPEDPFVARLKELIGTQPIEVYGDPVRDETGAPVEFAVKATKPGLFTQESKRTSIYRLLTQSIDGIWNLQPDLLKDTLVFRVKSGFPSVVTPPVPERIPQTADEARRMYPDFRMRLGVTETGEELAINLAKSPHSLVIGGTGTGKSVFARGVIESFRSAGWMLFLGDGKGTDYEGLHGQAGVVAISQSTPDHVRLVRMVRDELVGRQADAQRRRRLGQQDPFQRPPLLLLLDEYATMRAQIKDQYGSTDEFESDLKTIARLGREFKVHMILSTQEAYRDTIPGQLLGNLHLRISLGPPEKKTIAEVFPEQLQSEAARIGGTISKNDQGRSLALITDDEGNNRAVEFQSYFSYSPAESKPAPTPEIAAAWDRYRTMASERIPMLYPRLWFEVDGPDYGNDLDALYELPVVVLTGRDGQPRPEVAKYDPLSEDYLGGATGSGTVFHALDELPDALPTPDPLEDEREVPRDLDVPEVAEHHLPRADQPAAGTEAIIPTERQPEGAVSVGQSVVAEPSAGHRELAADHVGEEMPDQPQPERVAGGVKPVIRRRSIGL
ncbi:FtsK/SpoIIIE domain-containing protein [Rhodococcus pyridinivorans]|uniref:FtsK/SpoIIIE domain-containing protein n=1 Tax=Rhodococcus pyridinivorans TaxID=103816 RepID=UPI00265B0791|nr:FtsK/SpoIIIE domain-containing protein [Rhodococcus pyridinivorans]